MFLRTVDIFLTQMQTFHAHSCYFQSLAKCYIAYTQITQIHVHVYYGNFSTVRSKGREGILLDLGLQKNIFSIESAASMMNEMTLSSASGPQAIICFIFRAQLSMIGARKLWLESIIRR